MSEFLYIFAAQNVCKGTNDMETGLAIVIGIFGWIGGFCLLGWIIANLFNW